MVISEQNDTSTRKVLAWLKERFVRINIEDRYSLAEIKDLINRFSNKTVFFRRGDILHRSIETSKYNYLEWSKLNRYFHYLLQKEGKCLGSIVDEYDHNKLIDLEIISSLGIHTPTTHLVSSKDECQDILREGKKYILKSTNNQIEIDFEGENFIGGFPTVVTIDDIPSGSFFPSMIQEYVEKLIEIRTIFIYDQFFSMAIFSQNDDLTKIDYRCFDLNNPNRQVPFVLPNSLRDRLQSFTKQRKYTYACFDLILTPKGKYYFLEANPIGQYDFVSVNCNYYLDKYIAEYYHERQKFIPAMVFFQKEAA